MTIGSLSRHGGAGFIGSDLTETLLLRGDHVRVIDNFATGRRENLADSRSRAGTGGSTFELIEGDIRDLETCRRAMQGTDFVLHHAAIPSVQRRTWDAS